MTVLNAQNLHRVVLVSMLTFSTAYSASVRECAQAIKRFFSRPASTLPGVPDTALRNFETLTVGDTFEIQARNQHFVGTVSKLTLEAVSIETSHGKHTIKLASIRALPIRRTHNDAAIEAHRLNPEHRALETRQREYLSFVKIEAEAWENIRIPFGAERTWFQTLSPHDRKCHLERVGNNVLAKIHNKYGVHTLGVHYNMHGGKPLSYIIAGGIRAGTPTVGIQLGRDTSYSTAVSQDIELYFYRTDQMSLAAILNEPRGDIPLPLFRMGSTIVLLNLDDKPQQLVSKGVITHFEGAFARFDPQSLLKEPINLGRQEAQGAIGFPVDMFVFPPIRIFDTHRLRLGRRLTWHEKSLAALRLLENIVETYESAPRSVSN